MLCPSKIQLLDFEDFPIEPELDTLITSGSANLKQEVKEKDTVILRYKKMMYRYKVMMQQ